MLILQMINKEKDGDDDDDDDHHHVGISLAGYEILFFDIYVSNILKQN